MENLPESKRPVGSVVNVIEILNSRQKTIKIGLATTPSRGTWGFNFSFKKKKNLAIFLGMVMVPSQNLWKATL